MKRKRRLGLIACIAAPILLAAVFLLYAGDYYHADTVAVQAMTAEPTPVKEGVLTSMSPYTQGDTGLIFYPGGKVEAEAYIPLLDKLRDRGITCVLVEMPFNLAVFNANAADKVYSEFPEIKHWYIGGHSLGGVMASAYAAKHKDKIDGLVLLGSYIYGDYVPKDTLTIYGSNDGVLDRSKIPYTENVVVIEGGNHAGFGNYGDQAGDGPSTIGNEAQQITAAKAILDFIQARAPDFAVSPIDSFRFEGNGGSPDIRKDIESVLARQCLRVRGDLQYTTPTRIVIAVYPDQGAYDAALPDNAVAGSPACSGDGKIMLVSPDSPIRIPGIPYEQRLTMAVHEYAHLLVNDINPEAPIWLAEGIACHEGADGRYIEPGGTVAASLPTIPFRSLEDSYYDTPGADVYSFLAVRYIVDICGYDALNRLLSKPGEFERILDMSKADFDRRWNSFIRNFGKG